MTAPNLIPKICVLCEAKFSRYKRREHCSIKCRFWDFVAVGDGCWNWQNGFNNKGYGVLRHGLNFKILAHRFSYELNKGFIPTGLNVLHKCDNRRCVRPGHLFIGTFADNTKDMMQKERNDFTPHVGEANGLAVLTEDSVRAIRISRESRKVLASRYGVTLSCIKAVRSRQNWKHIP